MPIDKVTLIDLEREYIVEYNFTDVNGKLNGAMIHVFGSTLMEMLNNPHYDVYSWEQAFSDAQWKKLHPEEV
jgi:hypothetical protein